MTTRKSKMGESLHARRVYKNPPIHEAVCEFQFSNPEDWNLIHGGQFIERVKKRYSGKPTEQRILRVTPPRGEMSGATPPSIVEITKVQLKSVDGRQIVAIGPGILSVHSLRPYAGWELFRRQIAEAFGEYIKITRPKAVRRIGLRYINQIFASTDSGTVPDFLTTPPYAIPHIAGSIDGYANRAEYSLDKRSKAIVQLASIDAPPSEFGIALDIDVSRTWQDDSNKTKNVLKVVDELRTQERQVFEALITPKTRDLFDA